MNHPSPSRLQRYVLRETAAEESLRIEAHVGSCAICRRRVDVERRIDEGIAGSVPTSVPPGAMRATFDRVWERWDAEEARQAEDPAWTEPAAFAATASQEPGTLMRVRRRSLVYATTAALAATVWITVVLQTRDAHREDAARTPPPPFEVATHDATGATPAETAVDETRLDPARLRRVREAVAAGLRTAAARHPEDDARFVRECEGTFRPLRSEGWPLSNLVRSAALDAMEPGGTAPDRLVRSAALRYAARDASGAATLARALERPDRTSEVLALLERGDHDLASSPSLIHALERTARGAMDSGDAALARRSLAVLATSSSMGARRALVRVLERQRDRVAAAAPGREEAAAACLWLALDVAPTSVAVPVLLSLGRVPTRSETARNRFLARAAVDPTGCVASLAPPFVDPRADGDEASRVRDPGLAWATLAGLRDLAPTLLARLREEPADVEVLDAIVALGDAGAMATLFAIHTELAARPEGTAIRERLVARLARDDAARHAVGAATRGSRIDALVDLAASLPPDGRSGLLLACFAALPHEADEGGYREQVLTALARLGSAEDGRELLAWLEAGHSDDPVFAVAWLTADRLVRDEAARAWAASGAEPHALRRVARATTDWPERVPRPSSRELRDLTRSWNRAVLPARRSL